MSPMLPLAGLRVVAVEQYGAGPFGTMQLADLGAEVVKIENPADGGDMGRQVGPYFSGPGDSHFFQSLNRNKRSLTLDLKRPEARAVLQRLAARSDALLENLRGDQAGKLRLTYADLKDANRRLVCAHLSAYGRDGERASWPGFDYLMQAEAGYLSLTGEPAGPPARFGLSVVDFMTGLFAAFALLAGVTAARETGEGRDVDVDLFGCALQNLNYLAAWYLNEGHAQGREARSAHPSLTPSQLFPTRDGWIFIMCNKETFWPALCERIGRPELATDPAFATAAARLRNRGSLTALLDDALRARTTSEWMKSFAGRVPAAPVNDIQTALDNPLLEERGLVWSLARPGRPDMRVLGSPFGVGGTAPPRQAAPALGADSLDVLREAGLRDDEIRALAREGVVTLGGKEPE